ncbi:ABC transporter ATP-binding protein [Reinekea sp. G2M2-21]|uniref:ABC transporter ATP-binding protein n=1 Tax=Reinekea sp. G2M2-21 TaxID=2788942 RepID=UPI0018AB3530|nr:ABC transporter ATP-binding protein [Reinekea sp. G2M2-21]
MIRLENIAKKYDLGGTNVSALDDISFTIEQGEFVAIMGPSGSGKSTLMNILGILDNASSGAYFLEGHNITSLPDKEQARIRNRHFGFIFQSFNLFPELSAIENVMLPMSYAGIGFAERKQRAAELLDRVELSHRMTHLPTMLSGGEQQRVAIARALSNQPNLILADEPTGNLPTDKGQEILDILTELHRSGTTIVMVTHNDAQGDMAQRVINIQDGLLHSEVRR